MNPTNLPVTPEIAQAVINNPDVTPDDLESIAASIANSDMGIAHPLYQAALDREAEIVLAEYLAGCRGLLNRKGKQNGTMSDLRDSLLRPERI